jgi:clan AA aspartic protease
MGLVYADLELINTTDLILEERGYIQPTQVRRVRVDALVDSGAFMLAINENIREQMGLTKTDEREAVLADGTIKRMEVVGPIDVRFANRKTVVYAMVLPGECEVLLGAIPMEDMDVIIDPRNQRLSVNPETPYIPKMKLK